MSKENKVVDINNYEKKKKIGSGGFGSVYKAKNKLNGFIYAVKISNFELTDDNKDSKQAYSLFIEINIAALMNHPAITKLIGYSHCDFEGERRPTIIMEYIKNGSLRDILCNKNPNIKSLNPTQKLIIIYGIASAIKYMHENEIIHRDLKPENILIDEECHPKIADFGLSKILETPLKSLLVPTASGIMGTPIYMSPEILVDGIYTKSGDIYAFAIVVFEIITGITPFTNFKFGKIVQHVGLNGSRPSEIEKVHFPYKKLIEDCWKQNYEERPNIQKIVYELKNNKEFLTNSINKKEFFDYVRYVDNCETNLKESQQLIHYITFIRSTTNREETNKPLPIVKPKIPLIRPRAKKDKRPELAHLDKTKKQANDYPYSKTVCEIPSKSPKLPLINPKRNIQPPLNSERNNPRNQSNYLYPSSEYEKLNQECKNLVKQAQNDSEKLFIVGQCLIEGIKNFPKNVELGLKYIEKANQKNYTDSKVYYVQMLIKGNIIEQDIEKAKQLLNEISPAENSNIFALKGKIARKEKKYQEALNYYQQGLKNKNKECMYMYAKMLFLGEGKKDT